MQPPSRQSSTTSRNQHITGLNFINFPKHISDHSLEVDSGLTDDEAATHLPSSLFMNNGPTGLYNGKGSSILDLNDFGPFEIDSQDVPSHSGTFLGSKSLQSSPLKHPKPSTASTPPGLGKMPAMVSGSSASGVGISGRSTGSSTPLLSNNPWAVQEEIKFVGPMPLQGLGSSMLGGNQPSAIGFSSSLGRLPMNPSGVGSNSYDPLQSNAAFSLFGNDSNSTDSPGKWTSSLLLPPGFQLSPSKPIATSINRDSSDVHTKGISNLSLSDNLTHSTAFENIRIAPSPPPKGESTSSISCEPTKPTTNVPAGGPALSWGSIIRNAAASKPSSFVPATDNKTTVSQLPEESSVSHKSMPSPSTSTTSNAFITEALSIPFPLHETAAAVDVSSIASKVMSATGTTMDISTSRVSRQWTFLIRGKSNQVLQAKNDLMSKLSSRPASSTSNNPLSVPNIDSSAATQGASTLQASVNDFKGIALRVPASLTEARRWLESNAGTRIIQQICSLHQHCKITLPSNSYTTPSSSGDIGGTEVGDPGADLVLFEPGSSSDTSKPSKSSSCTAARNELYKHLSKLVPSDTRPYHGLRFVQILLIDKSFHPFLYGVNQGTLKSIMMATHARVQFPGHSDAQHSRRLLVEADTLSSALKAVEMLSKIVQEKSQSTKLISLDVKKCLHKHLIGVKGRGLQDLLEKTECALELPLPSDPSSTVYLRGPEDQLMKAVAVVMDRANKVTVKELVLTSLPYRWLMTKERYRMKALERPSKADISDIDTNAADDKSTISDNASGSSNTNILGLHIHLTPDRIQILGDEGPVNEAVAVLEDILAHLESLHHSSLLLPDDFILDRRVIARLHASYQVDILVPSTNRMMDRYSADTPVLATATDENRCWIVGKSEEAVLRAKDELHRLIESPVGSGMDDLDHMNQFNPSLQTSISTHSGEYNKSGILLDSHGNPSSSAHSAASSHPSSSPFKREIIQIQDSTIAKHLHRYFYALREEHHINVHLQEMDQANPGSSVVLFIEGSANDVNAAKYLLENQYIQDAKENFTITMKVPVRFHAALIGKGGKYVKVLMKRYHVTVRFSSHHQLPHNLLKSSVEQLNGTGPSSNPNPEINTATKGTNLVHDSYTSGQVTIEGHPKDVAAAKLELLQLLAYEQESRNETHIIPDSESYEPDSSLHPLSHPQSNREAPMSSRDIPSPLHQFPSELAERSRGDIAFERSFSPSNSQSLQSPQYRTSQSTSLHRSMPTQDQASPPSHHSNSTFTPLVDKDDIVETIIIPSRLHAALIGPRGSRIKEMLRGSGPHSSNIGEQIGRRTLGSSLSSSSDASSASSFPHRRVRVKFPDTRHKGGNYPSYNADNDSLSQHNFHPSSNNLSGSDDMTNDNDNRVLITGCPDDVRIVKERLLNMAEQLDHHKGRISSTETFFLPFSNLAGQDVDTWPSKDQISMLEHLHQVSIRIDRILPITPPSLHSSSQQTPIMKRAVTGKLQVQISVDGSNREAVHLTFLSLQGSMPCFKRVRLSVKQVVGSQTSSDIPQPIGEHLFETLQQNLQRDFRCHLYRQDQAPIPADSIYAAAYHGTKRPPASTSNGSVSTLSSPFLFILSGPTSMIDGGLSLLFQHTTCTVLRSSQDDFDPTEKLGKIDTVENANSTHLSQNNQFGMHAAPFFSSHSNLQPLKPKSSYPSNITAPTSFDPSHLNGSSIGRSRRFPNQHLKINSYPHSLVTGIKLLQSHSPSNNLDVSQPQTKDLDIDSTAKNIDSYGSHTMQSNIRAQHSQLDKSFLDDENEPEWGPSGVSTSSSNPSHRYLSRINQDHQAQPSTSQWLSQTPSEFTWMLGFSLPQVYHRYLIGRKGRTITNIMADTHTKIIIGATPSTDEYKLLDLPSDQSPPHFKKSASSTRFASSFPEEHISIFGLQEEAVLSTKLRINHLLLDIIHAYHLDEQDGIPPWNVNEYFLAKKA